MKNTNCVRFFYQFVLLIHSFLMGAHPGHIQEIMEVPVPRQRSAEPFLDPLFLATKKRLEDLIHPPTGTEQETLPMIRLTQAGDDVL